MRRYTTSVTTAADGTATAFVNGAVSGELHSIHYAKDGSNAFADGVDFTITDEETGEQLWVESNVNASTIRYPRVPTHSPAGAPALYAAGGSAVMARPGLARTRIKIVLAQGGATKTGKFHFVVA